MCCFAGPVTRVSNTQIFARRTGPGTQGLVYQMSFSSADDNAMILPLPVKTPASEGTVRFIDLQKYDSFFADLADGFPVRPPFQLTRSKGQQPSAVPLLTVTEVGDYVASFVPQMSDFDRLDPAFRISPEVWSQIPGYADHGFAVFQLKAARQGTPHPMALEFETRLAEGTFFPTVHIHDGKVHATESFDHTLYLQDPAFDAVVGAYEDHDVLDDATGLVRSDRVVESFAEASRAHGLLAASQLVHRLDLRGTHPNADQIIRIGEAPVVPRSVRKWGLRAAPVLLGAACLGFIIARRNRRAREIAAEKKLGAG